jgi:putative transposase
MDQPGKSAWAPGFRPREAKEQLKLHKTFSFGVKDANSGKPLVRLGDKVNTVWNYGNEISQRSAERGPRWAPKEERRELTKGASRKPGLPSQVIQAVSDEVIVRRREQGKPRLRWRVSKGAKRCLGGVPFTNQDIEISSARHPRPAQSHLPHLAAAPN